MPDVLLSQIKPNPFRDFDLHPIDPAQVQRLRASIHADGFWASVAARKIGNDYQLAFGHHRIEAARLEGLRFVPIDVRPLSDWQMVRMLASENATQRGSTAAAALDAVAAVSKVLVYQCLRLDMRTFGKIIPDLSPDAIENIWGNVRKGNGPGVRCLTDVLPVGAFTYAQLREAVGTLKDGGIMTRIIAEARARADAEIAAEAATPPPPHGKPSKQPSVPAKIPPSSPPAAAPIFDARCAKLFRLDSHLAEFRRIVTSEAVRSYLPVDQQYEFARTAIKEVGERELTAITLREACNGLFYERLGLPRHEMRTSSRRPEDHRIKDGLNLLRRGTHDVKRGCAMLAKVLNDGAELSSRALAKLDELSEEINEALESLQPDARKRRGNLRVVTKGGDKA